MEGILIRDNVESVDFDKYIYFSVFHRSIILNDGIRRMILRKDQVDASESPELPRQDHFLQQGRVLNSISGHMQVVQALSSIILPYRPVIFKAFGRMYSNIIPSRLF